MARYQSEEERLYYERTRKPIITMPTTRLGKIGCSTALFVWFVLLMLPCALFSLAMNGDITLQHGDVPDPDSHPLLQLSLVMDADNRGFRITRSVIQAEQEESLCIQTNVNYLLWEQRNLNGQNVVFCDCYERESRETQWAYESSIPSACS